MVNNKSDALKLIEVDLYDLLYTANRIREKNFGNVIKFCSIVNAKSGRCSEDCRFCSQSAHYKTNAPKYNLKEPEEILSAAVSAEKNGAKRFGIITSGAGIDNEKEWNKLYRTIDLLREKTSLIVDASLGIVSYKHAVELKKRGLTRYHHNLETSPSFFGKICTTHNYEDKFSTVEAVKSAGLELCCGGIFGLGENWEDRIDLAFILRDIRPNAVPINFLNPIAGTPMENNNFLTAQDCLRIIAIYRLIMPEMDISVCGGREKNLADMQSWMYYAGANASMLGNYLTTSGRDAREDVDMLERLGLCIAR